MHTDDYRTLDSLQKGSLKAFEKLYNQYSGKLYNYMLKMSSGDTYMSEEVVQRTFIRIWEIHTKVDSRKSFLSFLCTVAKNMLLNEYEHQTVKYLYEQYALIHLSHQDNALESEVEAKILNEYVDKLIDKLPPARRQIFILSRKDMLSAKEIAEKLNIAESTVQNQLSKAINFMKEELTKYYKQALFIAIIVFNMLININS